MTSSDFIGINWGSSNLRAYRIDANGQLLAERSLPAGIAGLDRPAMVAALTQVLTGWEDVTTRYAAGMVGSNIGWAEAPYAHCPASVKDLASSVLTVDIGEVQVSIVPGLTCRRSGGAVDILRGEEIEFFGALALGDGNKTPRHIVMPGTHSKWGAIAGGALTEFMTAISGEMYDRMTASGILASIIEGEAQSGQAFRNGVAEAMLAAHSLPVSMFGVRARVIRGDMPRSEAASHLRGLLIGSELRDALALFPNLRAGNIPIVGNPALSLLYCDALLAQCCTPTIVDAKEACVAGFAALHRARR